MNVLKYDVIVIGGGIAGLTATAYLSKNNRKVLVCEKENEVGGLVNSFDYNGFILDGGIRALENSGILFPMLRELGIDVDFVRSVVSMGIEDQVIRIENKDSVEDYRKMLIQIFPNNVRDIDRILSEIKRTMNYMEVLYGIDNPMFMNLKTNRKYLFKILFPWLFKYLLTVGKIEKLNTPVDEFLNRITDNQSLNDMITQHFFQKTPAFFALSYFSLYLDYRYPLEGTGMLIRKMKEYIENHHGEIRTNTKIEQIDLRNRTARDSQGNEYRYDKVIWAADITSLYGMVDLDQISSKKHKSASLRHRQRLQGKTGGDSVQTVYLTTRLAPDYFKDICTGHFFYTPVREGVSSLMASMPDVSDKPGVLEWVENFFSKTTYEISIPALRNEKLAPKGKTGLIVSALMDFRLVKKIKENGWYDEYKSIVEQKVIDVLDRSIFKGLKTQVIDAFSSTPLTIESRTGNLDGAITGWAFSNDDIPVVKKMIRIAESVNTPLPNILQAGQWSYSPSGLPISILTGRMAAYKALKK